MRLVGITLPYSPLAQFLGFTPLPVLYWPIMAGMVITYFLLTHIAKTWLGSKPLSSTASRSPAGSPA